MILYHDSNLVVSEPKLIQQNRFFGVLYPAFCRHRAGGGVLMADKKFEAILTLLVPQVVQLICVNYPVDEIAVSRGVSQSLCKPSN